MKGGRKIKTTLYIQQDQRRLAKKMKEISNKRRHRKIIQKMPSFKSSKTEQVLKERAEQQDWTLFKGVQSLFATKCSELDASFIKHISYGSTYYESKYTTLPGKFLPRVSE